MSNGDFVIWVTQSIYWSLTLIPEKNECDEYVNRCALVDSTTGKELEAIYFDALWLVPIFQQKSQVGLKQLAEKLKEITDKRGIQMISRTKMPENKRIKKTQKVVKEIKKLGDK